MKENNNLFAHFLPSFQEHAQKELLRTSSGTSVSYHDIDKLSAQFARYFTNLGIEIGARISVQVEKTPAALALYLACLRGGFVYHPLNTGYQASELGYFFKDAKPSVIICDEQNLATIKTITNSVNTHRLLTLNKDGCGTLTEQAKNTSDQPLLVERSRDDLAALLYSSGTTGVPKGIMLSHGNLLSNTQSLIQAWGFTDHDRLLHALPIFHVHGLFVALGCVLLSGASMDWLNSFTTDEVVARLAGCSVMMGVPTFYTRLLDEETFSTKSCATIRLFVSGSAPLLAETFKEFKRRTGHSILERYGMTETNMNTSNPLKGSRKPGTVGLPLPDVDVRIINELGDPVTAGEIGDLQVRGPNVFLGYWQMPEKTQEDFTEDGYFNTGDKASIDREGYISIVGRTKDLVITGGLNVYPKEVEIILDGLTGVKESAVIGVPHPDLGEAVVAVLVLEPNVNLEADQVITTSKEYLASFKVPKSIQLTDELPRNTMSKVQKSVLRDTYQHLFSN